jgi:hypothetical protein
MNYLFWPPMLLTCCTYLLVSEIFVDVWGFFLYTWSDQQQMTPFYLPLWSIFFSHFLVRTSPAMLSGSGKSRVKAPCPSKYHTIWCRCSILHLIGIAILYQIVFSIPGLLRGFIMNQWCFDKYLFQHQVV